MFLVPIDPQRDVRLQAEVYAIMLHLGLTNDEVLSAHARLDALSPSSMSTLESLMYNIRGELPPVRPSFPRRSTDRV